jgi:hypothetical protein
MKAMIANEQVIENEEGTRILARIVAEDMSLDEDIARYEGATFFTRSTTGDM